MCSIEPALLPQLCSVVGVTVLVGTANDRLYKNIGQGGVVFQIEIILGHRDLEFYTCAMTSLGTSVFLLYFIVLVLVNKKQKPTKQTAKHLTLLNYFGKKEKKLEGFVLVMESTLLVEPSQDTDKGRAETVLMSVYLIQKVWHCCSASSPQCICVA